MEPWEGLTWKKWLHPDQAGASCGPGSGTDMPRKLTPPTHSLAHWCPKSFSCDTLSLSTRPTEPPTDTQDDCWHSVEKDVAPEFSPPPPGPQSPHFEGPPLCATTPVAPSPSYTLKTKHLAHGLPCPTPPLPQGAAARWVLSPVPRGCT